MQQGQTLIQTCDNPIQLVNKHEHVLNMCYSGIYNPPSIALAQSKSTPLPHQMTSPKTVDKTADTDIISKDSKPPRLQCFFHHKRKAIDNVLPGVTNSETID